MIKLLKDYYDKNGIRYKVLSFDGDRYACQSYRDGKCIFLKVEELFTSPPKAVKVKFTDIVEEEKEQPVVEEVLEPTYDEPVYETGNEDEKNIPLKDNTEETAEDDFYADF